MSEEREPISPTPGLVLSGRSVATLLANGERLPFERVVALMRDAAAALDAASAAGSMHGALRPSCIHLTLDGHCEVSGFTFGRGGEPNAELGPADPAYEAPEQRLKGRVDGRADQYALAVIAYELLTGTRRTIRDAGIIEIQPLEIPMGRPLATGVPVHAGDAIRKATARDPEARFETSAAFVDALALGAAAQPNAPHLVQDATRKAPRSRFGTVFLLTVMIASTAILFAPSGTTEAVVRTGEVAVRWWRSWTGDGVDLPRLPRDDLPRSVGPDTSKGAAKTGGTGTSSAQQSTIPPAVDRTETSRGEPGNTRTTSASTVGPGSAATKGPDRRETGRASSAPIVIGVAATAEMGVLLVITDLGRPLVRVNSIPRGRAPLALQLRPGTYRVSLLTRVAYRPRAMQITVAAGDTAYAEFVAPDGAFPDDTLASLGLLSTTSSAGKYRSQRTKGPAAGT